MAKSYLPHERIKTERILIFLALIVSVILASWGFILNPGPWAVLYRMGGRASARPSSPEHLRIGHRSDRLVPPSHGQGCIWKPDVGNLFQRDVRPRAGLSPHR